MKTTLYGALSYLVITFTFAVLWHVVIFEDMYLELGYFGNNDPKFSLGFLAIATQGLLLSFLYPRLKRDGGVIKEGIRFGILSGLFLWSTHVVAHAAKVALTSIPVFMGMETAYLVIQMGIAGIVMAWIYEARESGVGSGESEKQVRQEDGAGVKPTGSKADRE